VRHTRCDSTPENAPRGSISAVRSNVPEQSDSAALSLSSRHWLQKFKSFHHVFTHLPTDIAISWFGPCFTSGHPHFRGYSDRLSSISSQLSSHSATLLQFLPRSSPQAIGLWSESISAYYRPFNSSQIQHLISFLTAWSLLVSLLTSSSLCPSLRIVPLLRYVAGCLDFGIIYKSFKNKSYSCQKSQRLPILDELELVVV
jgi:hypothetical protein